MRRSRWKVSVGPVQKGSLKRTDTASSSSPIPVEETRNQKADNITVQFQQENSTGINDNSFRRRENQHLQGNQQGTFQYVPDSVNTTDSKMEDANSLII